MDELNLIVSFWRPVLYICRRVQKLPNHQTMELFQEKPIAVKEEIKT